QALALRGLGAPVRDAPPRELQALLRPLDGERDYVALLTEHGRREQRRERQRRLSDQLGRAERQPIGIEGARIQPERAVRGREEPRSPVRIGGGGELPHAGDTERVRGPTELRPVGAEPEQDHYRSLPIPERARQRPIGGEQRRADE